MDNLKTYFLYLTVFLTGAAILIIEIAGARILAPFYGSTIYVWSSLITITMACLALGYFVGGKLADKKPNLATLYFVIFLAGLITILVPKIDAWILLWSYNFGMIWGPLLATMILFSLPLFLLAMITPLAIKLKTQTLDYLGTTTGNLYAISTAGSLMGALITGFWLIPNVGVAAIINFTALVLLVIPLAWLAVNQKFLKLFFSLILIAFLFFIPSYQSVLSGPTKVVYQAPSFYGEIKVVDQNQSRFLLINGIMQSGINKGTKETSLPYINDILLARLLVPKPEKALFFGLGAGVIPRELKKFGISSDIVEIDPKIAKVAEDYFYFSPGDYHLYFTDGRYFIKNTSNKYDLVIIDAFAGAPVPAHLLSQEAFIEIKEKLTANGILAINVTGSLPSQFIQSLYLTLKQVYPDVLVIAGDINDWTNVEFIASSNLPDEFTEVIKERCQDQDCLDYYLDILNDYIVKVEVGPEAKIITDDYNPAQYWQSEASQSFRQEVWRFFGKDLFVS